MNKLITIPLSLALLFLGWKSDACFSNKEQASTTGILHISQRKLKERKVKKYDLKTPEYAKDCLREIAKISDPEKRNLATIALVQALPLAELIKWLDGGWFTDFKDYNHTIFHTIALERIRKEDPESYLTLCMKNYWHREEEMKEFAENQPEVFLSFLRKNSNPKIEFDAIRALAEKHPYLAFQRIQEIAKQGDYFKQFSDNEWKRLFDDATGANELLLKTALLMLPDNIKQIAKQSLYQKQLHGSFEKTMASIMAEPKAKDIFSAINWRDTELNKKLLEHVATLPKEWKAAIGSSPFEYINTKNSEAWFRADLEKSGFSKNQCEQIRNRSLETMPAENALQAINDLNLSDDDFYQKVKTICSSNMKDKDDLLKMKELLNGDKEQKLIDACLTLQEKNQTLRNMNDADPKNYSAALLDIVQVSNQVPKNTQTRFSIHQGIEAMNPDQLKEFTSQYADLPAEKQLGVAKSLSQSFYFFFADHPDAQVTQQTIIALENHPSAENGKAAAEVAATYVAKLVRQDANAATGFVQKLPEGNAKAWAEKNLIYNWQLYDQAAASAYLQRLPAQRKISLENYLQEHGVILK